MPPRIRLPLRTSKAHLNTSPYQPIAPFLYPCLRQPQQQRNASILNQLSDTPGSYNKRIRKGQGPSSGKGKTAGRGHKGQKQHGKVPAGFNGGQTPDEVVAGPRGFENVFATQLSPVNLNRIQYWIANKRLDPSKPITLRELNQSRCVHGVREDGVKLLARGKEELTTPIHIVVSRASAAAIEAVEKAGGTVTTRYYTPFAVQQILKGKMDPIHSYRSQIATPVDEGAEKQWTYRLPDPVSRKALEYYRDEAHRGYLSHLVEENQTPSLYFRVPGEGRKESKAAKGKVVKGTENRIW